MTKGEAPTTAEQGQAPAEAAVTENTAAAAAAAPEQAASAPQYANADRLNAAEQAAVAAAAAELEAPVEAEVAAQLASAAEAQAKAKADFDEKKDKEDKDAEDAPVDLAMAPADIADVIAAADGARAVSGEEGEGEASALAGDGVPVMGLVAAGAVAIGAGILIASDDEDEAPNPGPDPDPEPEPEPEPEPGAPEFTSEGTAEVDENVSTDTVVYDADATDAEGDEITYSIDQEGEDADAFTIDADTGEVRFVNSPDFETQESYTITVVATDSEGNAAEQEVVITINDIDETVVDLDAADTDNNPNTPNLIDAADGDVLFTDDAAVASYTIITNFEEGDQIQFSEGAEVSFTTGPDDANDLQITINEDGVVSEIILDDVLGDDVGFIFDEATAEEAVGFDFFSTAPVTTEDAAIA